MATNVIARQRLEHNTWGIYKPFMKQKSTFSAKVINASSSRITLKAIRISNHEKFPPITLQGFLYGNLPSPGDKLMIKGYLKVNKKGQPEIVIKNYTCIQPSAFRWIFDLRTCLFDVLQQHLPTVYSTFLCALLMGTAGIQLQKEFVDVFRDLGLIHMLVVSGAQVALITSVMAGLLSRFLIWPWLKFSILLFINTLFLIMTGGDVSIVRAVLMTQITLFLTIDYRQKQAVDILYLTAIGMLFFKPDYIFKPGFSLSFLATFGLIDLKPRLDKLFGNFSSIPLWFRDCFATCLAPLLLTLPVVMYLYFRLDWLTLIANLVMSVFIEVVVLAGFFGMLIGLFIPFIAQFVFLWLLGIMTLMLFIAKLLYSIPGHTFYFSRIFSINIIIYYLFVIVFFYYIHYVKLFLPYLGVSLIFLIGINYMLIMFF